MPEPSAPAPDAVADVSAAPEQPARPTPTPGKIPVPQYTVDRFTPEQNSALTQANMERTIKGLPSWIIADFVRAHPGKFPEADHAFDQAEHAERAAKAPQPSNATRVDQRPVP